MRRIFRESIGSFALFARPLKSAAGRVIVAAFAAFAALIGSIYWSERADLKANEHSFETLHSYGAAHTWIPFDHEGVNRPHALTAANARLGDDEEVIGVEVNGKARAYRLGAMKAVEGHIVNDVVADVPVSVLYCDLSDCARSFVGRAGGTPLAIRLSGMMDGEMIVKFAGTDYRQGSGAAVEASTRKSLIPLTTLPLERSTWKRWKGGHPTTDVFVGLAPRDKKAAD